jgi:hypothetical protein
MTQYLITEPPVTCWTFISAKLLAFWSCVQLCAPGFLLLTCVPLSVCNKCGLFAVGLISFLC